MTQRQWYDCGLGFHLILLLLKRHKPSAGPLKRLRGLHPAHSRHPVTAFAQIPCQMGKIPIRTDDHESLRQPPRRQIHRVYRQLHIRRILAAMGVDQIHARLGIPPRQQRRIAVYPPDAQRALLPGPFQDNLGVTDGNVLAIDQDRDGVIIGK